MDDSTRKKAMNTIINKNKGDNHDQYGKVILKTRTELEALFADTAKDGLPSRRANTASSGNAYDPESLITGDEISRGLTYHDKRQWPSKAALRNAIAGNTPVELIPIIAPRVKDEEPWRERGYL